ncbi:MAG: hypothetical protein PHV20_05095 [Bacteroidales bacterium]|nr:hypothetical protein [Bacteroidales bacterium]
MNKLLNLILIQILIFTLPSLAQNPTDSLIRFSDLKYHSDFEKEALSNFVSHGKDTFNLFLAIDEKMTAEEAQQDKTTFSSIFDELNRKKIESRSINKKIKLSYSDVHSRFLQKYNENEYFPVMFQSGTYNCVSASMLYAMVFDRLKIPYKVMASSNHVYLIGNPGSNSIVIETTNPSFEKAIFNGDFQQQYVNYLRSSKMISELEYKNKSVEEIFEEKFNEVKSAEFHNLPGFQYYNKALTKYQKNEIESAFILCQKAYFFYPDNQVKILLHTTLLYYIDKCNFDKVTDIDLVALVSKFEDADLNATTAIFNNIINHHLQYTNKENFCDSLYQRLISRLTNKKTIDEISFSYNMQMSYRYQNTDKVEKYVANALSIKGNHQDANLIMKSFLQRKLYSITNSNARIDTINQLQKKYNYDMINPILSDNKLIAYLLIASESINSKKIAKGEKYLLDFEKNCSLPLKNQMLTNLIEDTYHSVAIYYYYKGNKVNAKNFVSRGLKYVPESKLLQSVLK